LKNPIILSLLTVTAPYGFLQPPWSDTGNSPEGRGVEKAEPTKNGGFIESLVGGLFFFNFSIYWECHHPN